MDYNKLYLKKINNKGIINENTEFYGKIYNKVIYNSIIINNKIKLSIQKFYKTKNEKNIYNRLKLIYYSYNYINNLNENMNYNVLYAYKYGSYYDKITKTFYPNVYTKFKIKMEEKKNINKLIYYNNINITNKIILLI